MKRTIKPIRKFGGIVKVPGDKSIGHRAALFSILSRGPITIINFPNNEDCRRSLNAAEALGVRVEKTGSELLLTPPESLNRLDDTTFDCGNSGTTARLLAGIIAGSNLRGTITGDSSLSQRPMKRIIEPLKAMGAEVEAADFKLPMTIKGRKLLPFEYRLPVASAQVKSALLLAALASSCSISVYEDTITRDHTEVMIGSLGEGISVREIRPQLVQDPDDPRKKKMVKAEDFKKEIKLTGQAKITGGTIHVPGDISSAAFFMSGAAIARQSVTVENLGLNPTRTAFLEHLKAIGCSVEVKDKANLNGEIRGSVTVTGAPLKARKIVGANTAALIDEIPIIAVMAVFAEGTTLIRNAEELRVKESDRLSAIAENLNRMGVKCGLLEDGLAIEGAKDKTGADFVTFDDHRIAMAFSIASLFLVGPSTIDDDACVGISFPNFYEQLKKVTA